MKLVYFHTNSLQSRRRFEVSKVALRNENVSQNSHSEYRFYLFVFELFEKPIKNCSKTIWLIFLSFLYFFVFES
jgi:hypothetical protein